jgi:hypothetical protein
VISADRESLPDWKLGTSWWCQILKVNHIRKTVFLSNPTAAAVTSRPTIARVMTVANIFFWLVFVVLFLLQSHPYKPHKLSFEEASPSYIFFGRDLREVDTGMGGSLPPPLMKVTSAIQKASFVAAKPYYWYFTSHEITVDRLYWHVSVGGYYLVVVCFFSFLQWYLLGFLLDHLRGWATS